MSNNPPPLDLTEIAEKLAAQFFPVGGGTETAILRSHLATCIVHRVEPLIRAREQSAVSQALQEAAEAMSKQGQFQFATWLRERARAAQGDPQETKKSVKT